MASPMPEATLNDYTTERIEMGLQYADTTLRNPERKLTLFGQRAILLYQKACTGLLKLQQSEAFEAQDKNTAREELLIQIRQYEQSIADSNLMRSLGSSNEQEMQDRVLELKRIEFFARYGVLLAGPCKQLKIAVEEGKTENWHRLTKAYWTEINDRINREKVAYKNVLKGKMQHDDCPTILAVAAVCDRIGLTVDQTLSVIHLYAARNDLVHSDFEVTIREKRWFDLRTHLYKDLINLPAILPPEETTQLNLMQHLINTLIDMWFTREDGDYDNIQAWKNTEALEKYQKALQGRQDEQDKAKRTLQQESERHLMKRLRDEEKLKRLLESASSAQLISTTLSIGKGKRVASARLQVELESFKKQKKQFDTTVSCQVQVQKLTEAYIATF